MGRRRTNARQCALPAVDTEQRLAPERPRIDMTVRELGSFVGACEGKNLFIVLCDRCHRPGVRVRERFYHSMPCDRPCTLGNAPGPSPAAMIRLLKWYQWAQDVAREHSLHPVERAKRLEAIVYPMTPALLAQLTIKNRRHLPTVTECRLIRQAMANTEDESWQEPLEIEDWTAEAKSTS